MDILFRKTTYSRPLKVNCFQKAAVRCTRISRGYFALGVPDCLGCGLWAEIPLASWLHREPGLGFADGQDKCPTPGFPSRPREWELQWALAAGEQSRDREGQGDERSGVLNPSQHWGTLMSSIHISHSTGEHQWGMLKPTAVALGCLFQICSPRSSFVW